jgi:hypothetical protein
MSKKTVARSKLSHTRKEKALAAKMLRRLREGYDLRTRKTRRLRAAIRVERYENELKLQIALDRLISNL